MPAKPKKKPAKRTSGGAGLYAGGRSLVWAAFDGPEKSRIRIAAGIAGKPMSQFVRDSALAEADRILENFKQNGK